MQAEETWLAVTAEQGSFVTHMLVLSLEIFSWNAPGCGHVFVFCKAFRSSHHPAPLKHANVPVLCSNWSQWCSPCSTCVHGKPPVSPAVGPPPLCASMQSNNMQTNTSLLFGTSRADPPLRKKGRKKGKGGKKRKGYQCLNSLVWLPEVYYFTGGNLPAHFIPLQT